MNGQVIIAFNRCVYTNGSVARRHPNVIHRNQLYLYKLIDKTVTI